MAKKPVEQADEIEEDDGILELEDNLSDIEKPEELRAGLYTGEVQDVQIATSDKGNRYYAIKIVFPQEEIPSDQQEDFPDGATMYWNRQMVPKKGDRRSMYNMRKLLEAFGLDSNTNIIDKNEWMGCAVRARVRHKPYQGEVRAEIQSLESAEVEARNGKAKGRQAAAETEEETEEVRTPRRGAAKKPAGRQTARR